MTIAADHPFIAARSYPFFTRLADSARDHPSRRRMMDFPTLPRSAPQPAPALPDPLRQKARELEAAFLAEMLAHAGLGASAGSFGGGMGEDQFASFLRQEQARLIASRGGIGLAESIFSAMTKADP